MGPRQQGDIGEVSAIEWFTHRGQTVFVPITHSPDVDLIVLAGGVPLRVQVKTSTQIVDGRHVVTVCTRGGNQSWNRITSRFDPTRCDLLFVLVGTGRRWCIPASRVGGATSIVVSADKYAEFEIDPGRPFAAASGA